MRPGRWMLPPSPPKGGEGDGENDRGGVGKRRRCIVMIQREVVNLGNMGRTTGYIHRAPLVNISRVQNLRGVTYKEVDERVWLHITVIMKRKEEKGRREGELNSRFG